MGKISIDGTSKTPTVLFDSENGVMELKGRSIPENSIEFYKPIVESLDDYAKGPKDKTKVEIQLEYFNTSSSKCILDVFKKLETLAGTEVKVNWFYEEDDEDMLEAGEDYQAIIDLPFKMIEVEEL